MYEAKDLEQTSNGTIDKKSINIKINFKIQLKTLNNSKW